MAHEGPMARIPQDDRTDNSGLEPGTSSRAPQALAAFVHLLARQAAREFLSRTAQSSTIDHFSSHNEPRHAD